MESLAHEYGQRVLPHFASYSASDIKASQDAALKFSPPSPSAPDTAPAASSSSRPSHSPAPAVSSSRGIQLHHPHHQQQQNHHHYQQQHSDDRVHRPTPTKPAAAHSHARSATPPPPDHHSIHQHHHHQLMVQRQMERDREMREMRENLDPRRMSLHLHASAGHPPPLISESSPSSTSSSRSLRSSSPRLHQHTPLHLPPQGLNITTSSSSSSHHHPAPPSPPTPRLSPIHSLPLPPAAPLAHSSSPSPYPRDISEDRALYHRGKASWQPLYLSPDPHAHHLHPNTPTLHRDREPHAPLPSPSSPPRASSRGSAPLSSSSTDRGTWDAAGLSVRDVGAPSARMFSSTPEIRVCSPPLSSRGRSASPAHFLQLAPPHHPRRHRREDYSPEPRDDAPMNLVKTPSSSSSSSTSSFSSTSASLPAATCSDNNNSCGGNAGTSQHPPPPPLPTPSSATSLSRPSSPSGDHHHRQSPSRQALPLSPASTTTSPSPYRAQRSVSTSSCTSTSSSSSRAKPIPSPISLGVPSLACLPAPLTPISSHSPHFSQLSAGLSPPGKTPGQHPTPLSAAFHGLHTPLFLHSPMHPVHFWSSLSPVATHSPRLTSGTAFQFPAFLNGPLAYSPLLSSYPHSSAGATAVATSGSQLENLGTPGLVATPTRTIPVL